MRMAFAVGQWQGISPAMLKNSYAGRELRAGIPRIAEKGIPSPLIISSPLADFSVRGSAERRQVYRGNPMVSIILQFPCKGDTLTYKISISLELRDAGQLSHIGCQ